MFFRLMAEGDDAISEEINDILTQVATNTPANKNTGNAILFECVKTIMAIESSNTLKTLAINILGKFLSNKESNSRY
jgi:AP-1 complex subunit gamma-1